MADTLVEKASLFGSERIEVPGGSDYLRYGQDPGRPVVDVSNDGGR